jgi:hypothetical protein
MLSERQPTTEPVASQSDLTPGQLVKRENRRDLPFGVGSSITVHVIIGLVLFFAAAFFYVANRPAHETKSQNVIIQTLVRTPPKTTAQVHRVNLKPIPHRVFVTPPMVAHRMLEPTKTSAQSDAAAAISQRNAAATQAQRQAAAASAQTELDQQRALAEAALQSPVTSTGTSGDSASGTAVSTTGDGTGDAPGGGRTRGGHGAWSERPASPFGGLGGNLHPDNCTPGRGGFFYHRH